MMLRLSEISTAVTSAWQTFSFSGEEIDLEERAPSEGGCQAQEQEGKGEQKGEQEQEQEQVLIGVKNERIVTATAMQRGGEQKTAANETDNDDGTNGSGREEPSTSMNASNEAMSRDRRGFSFSRSRRRQSRSTSKESVEMDYATSGNEKGREKRTASTASSTSKHSKNSKSKSKPMWKKKPWRTKSREDSEEEEKGKEGRSVQGTSQMSSVQALKARFEQQKKQEVDPESLKTGKKWKRKQRAKQLQEPTDVQDRYRRGKKWRFPGHQATASNEDSTNNAKKNGSRLPPRGNRENNAGKGAEEEGGTSKNDHSSDTDHSHSESEASGTDSDDGSSDGNDDQKVTSTNNVHGIRGQHGSSFGRNNGLAGKTKSSGSFSGFVTPFKSSTANTDVADGTGKGVDATSKRKSSLPREQAKSEQAKNEQEKKANASATHNRSEREDDETDAYETAANGSQRNSFTDAISSAKERRQSSLLGIFGSFFSTRFSTLSGNDETQRRENTSQGNASALAPENNNGHDATSSTTEGQKAIPLETSSSTFVEDHAFKSETEEAKTSVLHSDWSTNPSESKTNSKTDANAPVTGNRLSLSRQVRRSVTKRLSVSSDQEAQTRRLSQEGEGAEAGAGRTSTTSQADGQPFETLPVSAESGNTEKEMSAIATPPPKATTGERGEQGEQQQQPKLQGEQRKTQGPDLDLDLDQDRDQAQDQDTDDIGSPAGENPEGGSDIQQPPSQFLSQSDKISKDADGGERIMQQKQQKQDLFSRSSVHSSSSPPQATAIMSSLAADGLGLTSRMSNQSLRTNHQGRKNGEDDDDDAGGGGGGDGDDDDDIVGDDAFFFAGSALDMSDEAKRASEMEVKMEDTGFRSSSIDEAAGSDTTKVSRIPSLKNPLSRIIGRTASKNSLPQDGPISRSGSPRPWSMRKGSKEQLQHGTRSHSDTMDSRDLDAYVASSEHEAVYGLGTPYQSPTDADESGKLHRSSVSSTPPPPPPPDPSSEDVEEQDKMRSPSYASSTGVIPPPPTSSQSPYGRNGNGSGSVDEFRFTLHDDEEKQDFFEEENPADDVATAAAASSRPQRRTLLDLKNLLDDDQHSSSLFQHAVSTDPAALKAYERESLSNDGNPYVTGYASMQDNVSCIREGDEDADEVDGQVTVSTEATSRAMMNRKGLGQGFHNRLESDDGNPAYLSEHVLYVLNYMENPLRYPRMGVLSPQQLLTITENTFTTPRSIMRAAKFRPNANDVVVASTPRCGQTIVLRMLDVLMLSSDSRVTSLLFEQETKRGKEDRAMLRLRTQQHGTSNPTQPEFHVGRQEEQGTVEQAMPGRFSTGVGRAAAAVAYNSNSSNNNNNNSRAFSDLPSSLQTGSGVAGPHSTQAMRGNDRLRGFTSKELTAPQYSSSTSILGSTKPASRHGGAGGSAGAVGKDIFSRIPWLECRLLHGKTISEFAQVRNGRRVLKTHMCNAMLAPHMNSGAKYITVFRDPLDLRMSTYRFVRRLYRSSAQEAIEPFDSYFDVNTFARVLVSPYYIIRGAGVGAAADGSTKRDGSNLASRLTQNRVLYPEQTNEEALGYESDLMDWVVAKQKKPDQIMIVFYEDLILEPERVCRDMVRFLNLKRSTETGIRTANMGSAADPADPTDSADSQLDVANAAEENIERRVKAAVYYATQADGYPKSALDAALLRTNETAKQKQARKQSLHEVETSPKASKGSVLSSFKLPTRTNKAQKESDKSCEKEDGKGNENGPQDKQARQSGLSATEFACRTSDADSKEVMPRPFSEEDKDASSSAALEMIRGRENEYGSVGFGYEFIDDEHVEWIDDEWESLVTLFKPEVTSYAQLYSHLQDGKPYPLGDRPRPKNVREKRLKMKKKAKKKKKSMGTMTTTTTDKNASNSAAWLRGKR